MDIQQKVRAELLNRIRTDIEHSEKWARIQPQDLGQAISNRVVGIQDFTKHIVDTMNAILEDFGHEFDDAIEKDIFVERMKPTVSQLIKEYLER